MILALAVTAAELVELEAAHLRSLGALGTTPHGKAAETPDGEGVVEAPDGGVADAPDGEPADAPDGESVDAPDGLAAEARRALVARGLLTRLGTLPDPGDEDGIALVVRTALDVRSAAPRTIVVDRVVATAGPDQHDPHHAGPGHRDPEVVADHPDRPAHGLRLVHLLGDVACVEDVTDDGAHYLWLVLDLAEVPAVVAGVTVPEVAVPGSGAVRRSPSLRVEDLGPLLDGPTVLATLTVLEDGHPAGRPLGVAGEEHVLALGPRGCWVAGPHRPGIPPTGLVLRPVPPSWVEDHVRTLLRPGRDGRPPQEGTMAG